MTPTIEKISAITFRVMNMKASLDFYGNVLGMELLYSGERASFSSLRARDSASAILNLEQGVSMPQWGRLIFHVANEQKSIVLDNVMHINKKEQALKQIMSRMEVRISPDMPDTGAP